MGPTPMLSLRGSKVPEFLITIGLWIFEKEKKKKTRWIDIKVKYKNKSAKKQNEQKNYSEKNTSGEKKQK